MMFTPAKLKPKSFESRRNSFFYPGWMRLMFTCVLGRYVASTVLLVPKPFRVRWQCRWTVRGNKGRAPLQWRNRFWQSSEEGAGKRCSEFGGRCRKAMLGLSWCMPRNLTMSMTPTPRKTVMSQTKLLFSECNVWGPVRWGHSAFTKLATTANAASEPVWPSGKALGW